jgi:hypothetical protein
MRSICSGSTASICVLCPSRSAKRACRSSCRANRGRWSVQHVTTGTDLFNAICEQDMEGIVAKQASASYTPDATTWVKVKNKHYSQATGRHDFFDRRRARDY